MTAPFSRRDFIQLSAVGVALPLIAASPVANPAFAAVRRQAVKYIRDGQAPSLSIAVFRAGRPIWVEAFGFADRVRRVMASAGTRYAIASVSKAFTGTAVAQLIVSGKVVLDEPIGRHLGNTEIAEEGSPITVREALQHRSGIPKHWRNFFKGQGRPPPFSEITRDHAFITSAKGRRYLYSNMNYGLLAETIERTSGGFHRYLRKNIFQPAGLASAGFLNDHFEDWEAAVPYEDDGRPIPPYLVDEMGARDMVMTATDLARFGVAHLEGRFGEAARLMLSERAPIGSNGLGRASYGLGWVVEEDTPAALFSYGHTGEGPGGASSLTIVPEERLVVATIANAQGPPAYALNESIVDAISEKFATRRLAHPFQEPVSNDNATQAFAGSWAGQVRLPSGWHPVALKLGSPADCMISLGSGDGKSELTQVKVSADFLTARATMTLPAEDALQWPHHVRLSLERVGDGLDGSIGAYAQRGSIPHDQFWLSYRLRLHRD